MRLFQTLLLSAALALPSSFASAQALPGAPPAFVLTAARVNEMIAQCTTGDACLTAARAIALAARAAGLSGAQLDAVMGQVVASLVQAAKSGVLSAQVASLGVRGANQSSIPAVITQLVAIEAALARGNVDSIDLTALAQAAGFTLDDAGDDAGGDAPTGGTAGSPS